MNLRNSDQSWGIVTQFLHWFIFAFLIGQITLGFVMGDFPDGDEKWKLFDLHKALGMLALLIIVLRLFWRFLNVVPKDPPMPNWQKKSAQGVIWALYLSMLIIPISGYLMSTLGGHPIKIFDLFTIDPIMKNPAISKFANKVHEYMIWVIIGFTAFHIVGGLYHHFILKDNILRRMLPGWKDNNKKNK
ncbi:MAG: cytochrome b [Alphaproteobacteria bacterium]|nr:cytochrome b [Alphaproteobacteria bacterium]